VTVATATDAVAAANMDIIPCDLFQVSFVRFVTVKIYSDPVLYCSIIRFGNGIKQKF